MTDPARDDYDSPWKEALERYFPECRALLFPAVHAGIDWSQGYEFLDKELQRVVRDAELGRRLADKLVRVVDTDGEEDWLLVHIEVQGQRETDFAQRLFVYNYRIYDRYRRPVVSLAVLGDEQLNWRPDRFGYHHFPPQESVSAVLWPGGYSRTVSLHRLDDAATPGTGRSAMVGCPSV